MVAPTIWAKAKKNIMTNQDYQQEWCGVTVAQSTFSKLMESAMFPVNAESAQTNADGTVSFGVDPEVWELLTRISPDMDTAILALCGIKAS